MMIKKALWKDIWKGIWNNKARFFALLAIIVLGTGFFGGISATGPDMLDTANRYYQNRNLFDLKVISTYGIEAEDLTALEKVEGITAHPVRSIDAIVSEHEYTVRLYPYDAETAVNNYSLVSGRLPEKVGEIALDAEMTRFSQDISLGDVITFHSDAPTEGAPALADETYEVVGFVNSPIYIERISRGNTQVGKGSLDGFGVVHTNSVTGDLFSEIYLTFTDAVDAYTDEYEELVKIKTEEVEIALNGRPVQRINEIRTEGRREIFNAEEKIDDAKVQLADAESELATARAELDDAWAVYYQNQEAFETEIGSAQAEINRQQAVLDTAYSQYYKGYSEWEAGTKKYADAKAEWDVQKQQLLNQLDTVITLEGLVENPIPTPEGEALVAQVQQLLDADQQVTAAQEQLDRLAQTFPTQEENLRTAETELQTAEGELQTAETQLTEGLNALQSQKDVLTNRQSQRAYIEQQIHIPFADLTDDNKAQIRTEVIGQGNQTLSYDPFLNYLTGEVQVETVKAALTEEKNLQDRLQAGITGRENELNQVKTDIQEKKVTIQERKTQLIVSGQQLEASKRAYTGNKQTLQTRSDELQRAKNTLLTEVQSSVKAIQEEVNAADRQFAAQSEVLAESHKELQAAKRELDAGQAELTTGQNTLAAERASGENQLADAHAQIQVGENAYAEGLAAFEAEKATADKEIADAETELSEAKNDLQALEAPVYFVQDRSDNPGYAGYGDNANRISSIADVFPVFFFLIAALVSFTTMTRMVDEQRTQIGTLKGLGYNNFDIALKFLVYAATAGVTGTFIGLILGYWLFPTLIYNAYSSLYNLPDIRLNQYMSYTLIASLVALLCTVGPALLASYRTLKEAPASIMRPKAPKQGKRIFLERLPFIWNRLNFNAKITVRNLLRYKIRNSITVVGVAGCMALILTGFAISNSISGLAETQFSDVMKYDAVVALQPDRSHSDLLSYEEVRDGYEEISSHIFTLQETYKAKKQGITTQDVTIFVPEDTEKVSGFVRLKERKETEWHTLTNDGAIISEKLADLMDVGPGDELVIQDDEEMAYRIPIATVTENYTGHYVYLARGLYESIFTTSFTPNTDLLVFEEAGDWESEFAEHAMENENVALVTFMSVIHEAFRDTLESLDVITLVLIISAAALAFVVLYNLTNINVSERIRELSTIKVLGFFDLEVSLYVYRETFILTLLGILLGFGVGNILATVLLKMVEVDFMLFPIAIYPISYLYSTVLTLLFSAIVMVIMHQKLKKVNMIEALKSVE